MRVTLLRDCTVRFKKGTNLTVDDKEGTRLIAFGLAVAKTAAPRKTSKTKKDDTEE